MTKAKIKQEMDLNSDYKTNDQDVEQLFKERQDDKVGLLKESITDIHDMLKHRKKLHNEMIKNFDEIDLFINASMPKSSSVTTDIIAANHDLVKELLKKKIELQELKVAEDLNFWRDQAMLKKELREHMKEFRDMESQTSMLDNIVGI